MEMLKVVRLLCIFNWGLWYVTLSVMPVTPTPEELSESMNWAQREGEEQW